MSGKKENNEPCCSFCNKTEHEVDHLICGPNNVNICNNCVDICVAEIALSEEDEAVLEEESKLIDLPTPREIVEKLDEYIIGQEQAKKVLAVAVYNHYKRVNHNKKLELEFSKEAMKGSDKALELLETLDDGVELSKSNILMFGPSGSGKTLLAQTLSKILKVPFAIADATTLTEAGYVGEDVENILLRLIKAANFNLSEAQRGIIYIDEIDKLARKSENMSVTRDVSGEGVQQALLKIIESTQSSVPPNGGRKHPQQECISLDTSNILFILGGAFVGLDKVVAERVGSHSLGFERDVTADDKKQDELLAQVQPQDLIKYGIIPELVGRLPVIVSLNELTADDLVSILTEPKNSLVKQYGLLLKMDNVALEFDKGALKSLSERAIKLKTGARGLRSIIEGIMLDAMFDIPSDKQIEKIIITADVVDNKAPPTIIRKTKKVKDIA